MTVGSPQQSTKSFNSPVGVPIKKTPPITDLIHDKLVSEPKSVVQEKSIEDPKEIDLIEETKTESLIDDNLSLESKEIQSDPIEPIQTPTTISDNIESVATEIDATNTFAHHWEILFEKLFKHIPIIYFPLKGYIPKLKENKIHLELKNENQKEHFEPKIREVLSYLRTNYSDLIEDVVINVDETIVTRKIIYDTVDKLKNLNEQNIDFEEFNSILNLKVKE